MVNNYPKVMMVDLDENSNLMELITTDGPFSIVILDIDNKNIDVSEMYTTITETLGQRPFVFIGCPNFNFFQWIF